MTAPTGSPPSGDTYTDIQQSEEFAELRHAYRSFIVPVTLGFIAWYLLYVLLSNYAGGFMDTKVVGNINMAFVLGIAQFATTFLIAWWYARHANAKIDPLSDRLKAEIEARTEADG